MKFLRKSTEKVFVFFTVWVVCVTIKAKILSAMLKLLLLMHFASQGVFYCCGCCSNIMYMRWCCVNITSTELIISIWKGEGRQFDTVVGKGMDQSKLQQFKAINQYQLFTHWWFITQLSQPHDVSHDASFSEGILRLHNNSSQPSCHLMLHRLASELLGSLLSFYT